MAKTIIKNTGLLTKEERMFFTKQFEKESGLKVKSSQSNDTNHKEVVMHTEKGDYRVLDAEEAYELEKMNIEMSLNDEVLTSFLSKNRIENFLLDEAAYDYFKDFDEDDLAEYGLGAIDTLENSDLLNFISEIYDDVPAFFGKNRDLLDIDEIVDFIFQTEGFQFVADSITADDGNGIIWYKI